jgi:hypothetical protein
MDQYAKVAEKPSEVPHTIVVCMGSSCYLRGNVQNTEIINGYIEDSGLAAQVDGAGLLPLLRHRLPPLAPTSSVPA